MSVNRLDKYYTPSHIVKHTVAKAIEIIGKENITDIIEPSAGDGAFIEELDKLANELGVNVEYYDLYPSHPRIVKMDYKKLIKSYKRGRLIVGNPPFGTSSSLWKAFCKKSAKIGDYIAFISPASQYKSNYYFKEGELIYSELLNDVEYRGDEEHGGKAQKVRTCLNIYKVYDREEEEDWREDKVKTQLRFGRRYKDDEGYNNLYDYYLANMTSGPRLGTLCGSDEYYSTFGVSVIDENIRNKVHSILENELWKGLHKMRESNSCGTFFVNNTNFVECMKKLLYPTREERLEQDVQITHYSQMDEYDFYFGVWGEGPFAKVKQEIGDKCGYIGIKILNENKRKEIEDFFNNYDKKEARKFCIGSPSIQIPRLKDQLMRHLYPTREERLEQDIKIDLIDYRSPDFELLKTKYDWYLGRTYSFDASTNFIEGWGIKILNENIRLKVEDFLLSFKEKYYKDIKKTSMSYPLLNLKPLKDYLMRHLYPTREERLEQDILFDLPTEQQLNDNFYEFYIARYMREKGVIFKKYVKFYDCYGVKILNENKREDIMKVLNELRKWVISDESPVCSAVTKYVLKDYLIKHLYPQDSSDFLDYEYPEIKKPVKVEREYHPKPLFEIEYIETPIKRIKEIKEYKTLALF